jgi:hypothetical protein
MKTKIAIFLVTMGVFAITGCAGTQVAVNRFGITQPSIQIFQPQRNHGAIESEIRPFSIPSNQFGSSFGFNNFQSELTPSAFGLPYGSLTLFNGIQINPDYSLTLFKFNNLQFKFMPAMDGRLGG